MRKKKFDLSLANVESIVDDIFGHSFEPEEWLIETASKLNTKFKELRDDLRQHKNAWSSLHYRTRLAFHYYNISFSFNELFKKHQVDSQSVVLWLVKCQVVLKEIPHHQKTKGLLKLSEDIELNLKELEHVRDQLHARRDVYKNLNEDTDLHKVAASILALGDVTDEAAITEYLSHCGSEYKKRVERTIRNIALLKAVAFLEDCLSNPHCNPISAAIHTSSLSKAYFAAGIPDLGKRFENTSEHLKKTCLSFKGNNTDTKQKLKNLILEQVKDRRSLQQVKNVIEESYNKPLTSIDMAYIERKYSQFCSREFVDESVIYFNKLKENKNRQIIMDLLPQMKLCESLLRVPRPLNQLDHFVLLKRNYKLLKPEDASKSLKTLKSKCFEIVLEYVELAKKELTFIEVFIEFMDSFKDTQYLEAVLDLRHFCVTESPFADFIRSLLNLEPNEFSPHLITVQQAAKPLQNEDELFYVNKFKEFILSYLKSPEIRLLKLDGRIVLEVCSKKIVMSEILRQERFNEMLSSKRPCCEEVRFVATNAIHVDEHFQRSIWHGKNIVVMTKTLFVHDEITWDVSGNDGRQLFSSKAGTGPSGVGNAGEDGEAGESGGNVVVLAGSFLNSDKLTIISHGGVGGKGQTGGDGLDGDHGHSIDEKTFCSKFPPTARFNDQRRGKEILTTMQSILDYHSSIKLKWYERPVLNVSKYIPFAIFYKQQIMSDSVCTERNLDNIIADLNLSLHGDVEDRFRGNVFIEAVTDQGNEICFSFQRGETFINCQSFLIFKGANGKPGFKGGEYGMGGQGGFPGEISIRNTSDSSALIPVSSIATVSSPGAEGAPGLGGKYGNHGKNGGDMGYLDYSVSGFITSTWPKNFGFKGDSKLSLDYHENDDGNRVWCPHRRYQKRRTSYVSMGAAPNVHTESKKYQERTTERNNTSRESSNKATRKKTISHSKVLRHYQHQFNSIEKASLRNLHDELDNTNAQAVLAIEENQKMQDEVALNAQIMRCATFRQERKRAHDRETVISVNVAKKEENVNLMINGLVDNPNDDASWLALTSVRVTKTQLEVLCSILENVKHSYETFATMFYVQDLLLEKYRFVCLWEISGELESRETAIDSSVGDTGLVATIRYLKNFSIESNEISHRILGRLNQYIFSNNEEQRAKLSKFCKTELEYDCRVLKLLKTFIFEAGNDVESSKSTRLWYRKYAYFTEKQKRGFPVFPESVAKLDREFISHISSKNRKCDGAVISDFILYVEKKGSESVSCLELLAYVFNVNIRLYSSINTHQFRYILKENLNPDCKQCYHLLIDCDNKRSLLDVDVDYWKLEMRRKIDGMRFSKIISATEQFLKKEEFDSYLDVKAYLDNSRSVTDEELKLLLPPVSGLKTTVDGILQHFTNIEDKVVLEPQLHKLSPDYLGRTDILDNILKRFSIEGNHISAPELLRLVNSVLQSAAEGNKNAEIYRWIVIAYPQDQWINELLLMDLETLYKRSLIEKTTWRQYLQKIKNKAVLVVVRDKLRAVDPEKPLSTECIGDIFYLLSKIPTKKLRIGELDLAEWPYALKEKYWKFRLSSLMSWREDELLTAAYFTLSIENVYGSEIIERFIQLLIDKKFRMMPDQMSSILSNFKDERWNLSEVGLRFLAKCDTIENWIAKMQNEYFAHMEVRSTNCLVKLIEGNANTSASVKVMLPKVKNELNTIRKSYFSRAVLENTGAATKSIIEFCESDISSWVLEFKNKLESFTDESEKTDFLDNMNGEALAVITRGIELKRGFRLRDTQRLTVMILLQNVRNTLAQVATGEGKSLIVVAAAIIKALKGEKVDIITSSSVLAKRDATDNADIYKLFGIDVSHNCNDDVEVRKAAYSGNQVVYGDLSDFQRDYLLHEFYNINVLGDRKLESVVVDEVDSMLLDKGNNMLYLSHGIPGLDKLESLYLYIWQWINSPCCDREGVLITFDAKAIKESVLYDMFGMIRKKDLKSLDDHMTDVQACVIWERLVRYKIIDRQSRPTAEVVDRHWIEQALSPDFIRYTDGFSYLLMECISRDRQIQVPNCLKPFVELHLDKWIANAIKAYFMKAGEDYVVDVDRTGTSADRNPNITIIDKDTGTDQSNSQWVEALHQFLQLKHNCKLSVQSLKAVFISNVSYFKLYKKLYGLTGTLGSKGERNLLEVVHGADFVTIPTAKPKQFHEHLPIVCTGEEAWRRRIQEVSESYVWKHKRSVLIVCESVNDVELLSQTLGVKDTFTVHTYTREYEEFDITQSHQEIGPGHIIVATNLAGRGTDIKINSELKSKRGLHVILSYLPNNARIEQQAFGRAARCGDEGSGQLIIKSYEVKAGTSAIIHLKNQRDLDELERISTIKLFYENQICAEENCFSQFRLQYKTLKEQFVMIEDGFTRVNVPKEVQDILSQSCIDKWAFWLDENGELIGDLSNWKSRKALDKSLNKFISQLSGLKCESVEDWIACVEGYPVPMVKLAKYLIRKDRFDTAIALFDSVIQAEPNFSAAAHYYKAGALGSMINWESMSEEDHDNKSKLEKELIQASKLFEKLGNESMKNSAIVSKLKCSNKQDRFIVQIDAYEEQNKNVANLYRLFSQSIGDIFGHTVMPQSFVNYSVKDPLACTLHQYLLRDGILNHSVVTKPNMSESEAENLSCGYGIAVSDFNNFLNKWDGKIIKSFRGFKADLKHNLCLPSKEKFWKELIRMDFLSNEQKYLIVDNKKLAEVDPSLLDSLNQILSQSEQNPDLEYENGFMFLNPEQLPEQKTLGSVFLKDEFMELIERERYLALKNRDVFHFNSKCRFKGKTTKSLAKVFESVPQYFNSYDSISVQDFVRNKVSEKEAEIVLQELARKQIIERKSGNYYYRLATHFSKIDDISLSHPVYEPITKSLLHTRFAYRIAFQKMTSQINDGMPVSVRLKTKPYLSLFWDLYESKVICPIKVCKGKHSKDSVQNSLALILDRTDFAQLLNHDDCVPREDIEDLVRQLISKKLLKVQTSIFSDDENAKLEVNKLKDEWEAFDRKYRTYEKTVRKILSELLELSNDATMMHIVNCLGNLKSNLENLDVPKFCFKALTEAFPGGDFSNAQEMYSFISNGLDEIIILEEKRYTLTMILNTTLVICMGICQIAIGAIIDMWSVGAMTYAGNAFISEGISDIIFALGAIRSGYFSWEEYGKHKIESLVLTIASGGIGAFWSRGTKLSRVGSKLCAPGAMIGELKASQTIGAQVLRTANKSVGRGIVKQIGLKTLEGISFGIANMTVDATVDNFLQGLCDGIALEIMANIKGEFKSHSITSVLRKAFEVMGEDDARDMTSNLTQTFFGKASEWKEFESLAGKIFTCVSKGVSEATAKEMGSGQSTGNFSLVVQRLNQALVWVDRVRHLQEVRRITSRLLDELSKEIDEQIRNKTPVEAQLESNYERFEQDIIKDLKSQISARSGQILSHGILNPLLKEGAHTLVRYGGRKIKDFYRSFKESGYIELFDEYKQQYEESIEKAGDDVKAIQAVTKEYNDNLLSLLSKTRNPKLFSDIINENVPMDMTCLKAFIKMLPFILRRQGIQERVLIVVENDGDDVSQVFASGSGEGDERVIRLKVKDNHFEVVGSDGTENRQNVTNPLSNSCLYWALSEHFDLGMTEDEFRSSTATIIREDQEMQSIIERGLHQFGISLKMHGGAHPYNNDDEDDWSYNPEVDFDLCRGVWVDTDNGKMWQEYNLSLEELHNQRTEAYKKALRKINEIVTGSSRNTDWKKCQLLHPRGGIQPCDFEATIYDTVRVTKGFGAVGNALYPVEFKTKIQVKQGESVCHYVVEINTDAVYRGQSGPQGPHIGFTISRIGKQGPEPVTGHCLINSVGNEHLPHRAKEHENVHGIYHVADGIPESVQRIPVRKLFFGPNCPTTHLERDGNQSPRNRSYPSAHY